MKKAFSATMSKSRKHDREVREIKVSKKMLLGFSQGPQTASH